MSNIQNPLFEKLNKMDNASLLEFFATAAVDAWSAKQSHNLKDLPEIQSKLAWSRKMIIERMGTMLPIYP